MTRNDVSNYRDISSRFLNFKNLHLCTIAFIYSRTSSQNMRFFALISILGLVLFGNAIAIALPEPLPDFDPSIPLNGSITVSVDLYTTDSTPRRARVTGVEATLYYRWVSTTRVVVSYRIKDTSADSHPVYIETQVYLRNNNNEFWYRCNNNNGRGNEITCPEKVYTNSAKIHAIQPRECVNVQLGSDKCSTGGAVLNTFR
ncbi:hypothetical protein B0J11DRAFT_569734 [Dendryphion nanum]|uniref:Uncharacterized protein n=1 Tax=Dendryphion nanum TaxID=256645 RepID=A0A9P9II28_9PLEO|nr:hypothetical protein B0J11DRAFT_569734 [Dendryphion nanum]